MTRHNNWYVVYTYPNSEKKIYNELNKREITAYLPTKGVVRQWSDRKKKLEVPLFPNYVFVNIPPKDMWMVLMVNGVVKFVSFNGTPAVVRDSEIDLVKRLSSKANVVSNKNFYIRGEKVQVKEGVFSGLVGKVMNKKGMTRLYVELETAHLMFSIDIEAALLKKLD
ncbi:UpxY family transcription antiterminator [Fulvivirgaceae bacterium BMA12]|uniref:UpxY family transcription antiterminator n=1 Tax=Agaribacillus aureus TaxID=3051825 RepID=A0ABT8LM61_9BACT|nr:UpxY family transcription antiterminator [Fulvivirgaceae bacterium BMA12]